MPSVRIEPDGHGVQVAAGDTLLSAVERAGVILDTTCGGRGSCGKCAVRLVSADAPEPSEGCRLAFSTERLAAGWRLACMVRVDRDLVVEVPASSRVQGERMVVAGAAAVRHLDPAAFQLELAVPPASLADQRGDLERLVAAAGGRFDGLHPEAAFLRGLPAALRAGGERVAVIGWRGPEAPGRLASAAPASRRPALLGASFDLGTTTAVGERWDLVSGRRLAAASRANPQRERGADVISRCEYAAASPEGLAHLQRLAAGCLGEILGECLAAAKCAAGDVHDLIVAGNTVMTHLLLGVGPENIAQSPFAPGFTAALALPAAEMGLGVAPGTALCVVPGISGYVGGDIVAGLAATRLLDGPVGNVLFIDVGTNGEMVLVAGGRAVSCATAAGPAFEGARISHGCRAMSGAIEEVRFDGQDLVCLTIDAAAPRGICGTGLIDGAAALRRAGLLDETGRLLEPDELPAGTPGPLRARLVSGGSGTEVLLGAGREVPLTGRDLRELQLAKAAVRAGAETLLSEAGLSAGQLDRVILAGAFGSYIDPENALAIGLLPAVPVEKVAFGGNTSAAGARLALLDRAVRRRLGEIARQVEYLELSGRADFQERFAEAMIYPG